MLHKMGLYDGPLQSIKSGRKTIEVRLNDEKRRKLKIGDSIEFVKVPEQDERLTVEVLDLKTYESFKEMYNDVPVEDMDAQGQTLDEMVENTYKFIHQSRKKSGALWR